jgi:hypothetical protein
MLAVQVALWRSNAGHMLQLHRRVTAGVGAFRVLVLEALVGLDLQA